MLAIQIPGHFSLFKGYRLESGNVCDMCITYIVQYTMGQMRVSGDLDFQNLLQPKSSLGWYYLSSVGLQKKIPIPILRIASQY